MKTALVCAGAAGGASASLAAWNAGAKVIKRAFFGLLLLAGCATPQFTNPVGSGQTPDPFVCWDADTDSYYLLFTRGEDLCVFRSKTLANVRDGESKVIYESRDEDGIYGHIWAPEMHKAPNGKWYVYTSGAMRKNEHWGPKRLFILESKTDNPFDGFVYKGKPAPDTFAAALHHLFRERML